MLGTPGAAGTPGSARVSPPRAFRVTSARAEGYLWHRSLIHTIVLAWFFPSAPPAVAWPVI